MSANATVLPRSGLMGPAAPGTKIPLPAVCYEGADWNPEDFAREQIRSLVRQVFFAGDPSPIRQIVFSAADPRTDVGSICDLVGRALALETATDVAVVGRHSTTAGILQNQLQHPGTFTIKSSSTQVTNNLWQVPESRLRERSAECGTTHYWLSCLAELRNDFAYTVIHGPAVGVSSEGALLGQLADGIILVLDAHATRRAAVRKIKENLESTQSRILGTVLSSRKFPVPQRLYRWL